MSAMAKFDEHLAAHLAVLADGEDPELMTAAMLGGASSVLAALVSPTPENAAVLLGRIQEISVGIQNRVDETRVRVEALMKGEG